MFLKYNVHNFISNIRELEPIENGVLYDNITSNVTVTTRIPHHLRDKDKIRISYNYSGLVFKNQKDVDILFNEVYEIFNCDINSFTFHFKKEKKMFLTKINGSKKEHIIEIDGDFKDKFKKIKYNDDDKFEDKHKCYITYIDGNKVETLLLTHLSGNIFSLRMANGRDDLFFYEDDAENEIKKSVKKEEEFYIKHHYIDFAWEKISDCKIYNTINCLNIPLTFASENQSGLLNENIAQLYFDERKKELIPDIIDYEKKCFSPVYKDGDKIKPLYSIRFNLYFRDRGDDYQQWASNDGLYWNKPYTASTSTTVNGDYLGKLGFNDNDIYYRKLKVQKSFLRLNFYDSKDPFKQMLLFYSTVFLDSGDLYGSYIKNLSLKTDEKQLVDICNDLTCSFKLTDKFEHTKSSEGFYLHMFPDYIGETGRTVYMRVEFNHAGYGKTLPFMSPFTADTVNPNINKAIDFGENFPSYLINNENNDLTEYFNYLHIPVVLYYDSNKGEYVYYFKTQSSGKDNSSFRIDDGNMVINLYEPKLNG